MSLLYNIVISFLILANGYNSATQRDLEVDLPDEDYEDDEISTAVQVTSQPVKNLSLITKLPHTSTTITDINQNISQLTGKTVKSSKKAKETTVLSSRATKSTFAVRKSVRTQSPTKETSKSTTTNRRITEHPSISTIRSSRATKSTFGVTKSVRTQSPTKEISKLTTTNRRSTKHATNSTIRSSQARKSTFEVTKSVRTQSPTKEMSKSTTTNRRSTEHATYSTILSSRATKSTFETMKSVRTQSPTHTLKPTLEMSRLETTHKKDATKTTIPSSRAKKSTKSLRTQSPSHHTPKSTREMSRLTTTNRRSTKPATTSTFLWSRATKSTFQMTKSMITQSPTHTSKPTREMSRLMTTNRRSTTSKPTTKSTRKRTTSTQTSSRRTKSTTKFRTMQTESGRRDRNTEETETPEATDESPTEVNTDHSEPAVSRWTWPLTTTTTPVETINPVETTSPTETTTPGDTTTPVETTSPAETTSSTSPIDTSSTTKSTALYTTSGTIPEYPFVVPFIYKRKFPPAPICGGTIVTEKLILTAAYPIAVMPRALYCALPGHANLQTVTVEEIETKCIGIKEVYLDDYWKPPESSQPPPLNLAIVELDRKINFTWSISTGRIPFNTNITRFLDEGAICSLAAWKYRHAIAGPGFPLEEIATHLISQKVIIGVDGDEYNLFAEEGAKLYLCAANIGMPIICKCTIVGILIPPEDQTGYFPCTEEDDLVFLPILIDTAQRFLNLTIPDSFIPPHDDYDDDLD